MNKQLRITVNGKTYEVEAEILDDQPSTAPVTAGSAAQSAAVAPPVAAAPQAKQVVNTASGAPGDVPSPIAGTVVSVAKPEGSQVAAGDVLLVLEAMKMNTEVTSPCAGTVTKVNVSQGQSVEEGQALMTIA